MVVLAFTNILEEVFVMPRSVLSFDFKIVTWQREAHLTDYGTFLWFGVMCRYFYPANFVHAACKKCLVNVVFLNKYFVTRVRLLHVH